MAVTHLSPDERETVITTTDADNHLTIWTAQRTVITALRKKPHAFTETGAGFHGSTEWASFEIAVNDANLAGLAKRKGSPRPHLAPVRPIPPTMDVA